MLAAVGYLAALAAAIFLGLHLRRESRLGRRARAEREAMARAQEKKLALMGDYYRGRLDSRALKLARERVDLEAKLEISKARVGEGA